MSLFLLEGLALDPFYAASTFRTCGITSDLDGCSVRPVPASRKRMDTNHVCSNPTASPPSHRTVGVKHVIVPKDRSRHYDDDQWYETEAEKDAQDRRQGGKFSYSDLGVRRQRHGWHATQEQTLELLKKRGTAGKD